jgi:hypothetical protein
MFSALDSGRYEMVLNQELQRIETMAARFTLLEIFLALLGLAFFVCQLWLAVRLVRSVCSWLDAHTRRINAQLSTVPVADPPVSSWDDLSRKADRAFKVVGIPDDKYQPPR